jgi:hypothetical protein
MKNNSKPEKDIAASYNALREFKGRKYTGMKVGRSHKWKYQAGEWKERKATPDTWNFTYVVQKHRAGKAPPGSGAPTGTQYHWYIIAHQVVKKIDENTYDTAMAGIKYKLAHKRAGSEKWSVSDRAEVRNLIKLFQEAIVELREEERTA